LKYTRLIWNMVPGPIDWARTPIGREADTKVCCHLCEVAIVLEGGFQSGIGGLEVFRPRAEPKFGNRCLEGNGIRMCSVGTVFRLAYTATRRRQRSTNRCDRR